jgi:flavodoxin
MRIAIFFHSKTGNTEKVAGRIKAFFDSKKALVELYRLEPAKDLSPRELEKQVRIDLKKVPFVLSDYDLIFIGGPVWGMQPTPVVISFLKTIEKAEGKKFVLFLTCHGFTGSTTKKMSSILVAKGAVVIDFFTIKSLFSLGEKHLKKAAELCEKIYSKMVVL